MSKKILFSVVALALAASSCTKHDVPNQNQSEVTDPTLIYFSASAMDSKIIPTTESTFDTFYVYAYQGVSGQDIPLVWADESPSHLMGREQVSKVKGVWKTSSLTPWPTQNTRVQFFAFYPVDNPSAGLEYVKNADSENKPVIKFKVNKDVGKQLDFLYAGTSEITSSTPGTHVKVPLIFTHALTKVKFSAKVQEGQTLYLSELTLCNLALEGTFKYGIGSENKGSWVDDAQTNTNFSVKLIDETKEGITSTSEKDVTTNDGATLLIPQKRTALNASTPVDFLFTNNETESYIKMVYSLKSTIYDEWIVGTGPKVENQVTAYLPVAVNFGMNDAVNIVMEFGVGNGGYYDNGSSVINGRSVMPVYSISTEWNEKSAIPCN
ncbi:MAG: fimbrillin family protein [Phocaeicola sp.]